jgi:hypothetical protein
VYRAGSSELIRATVKLRKSSDVLGPDCGSLTPLAIGSGNSFLVIGIGDSAAPWFAVPKIPAGKSLHLSPYPPDQRPFGQVSATLDLCDTCQGPCQSLASRSDLELSNGMVLRFGTLSSFEGATVTRLMYSSQ